MEMTIRSGFLFLAATALVMACGGSVESTEPLAGGQSALDGKKDPTKPGGTKPTDPNAGGACFWDGEGSDTSCKTADVWKDYAWQTCKAKGAELTNLVFGDSCDKDGFRAAKFECCTAGDPPKDPGPVPPKDPPKDPGDPTPAPSSCIYDYANNACQSEAAWKDYAFQVCAKQGLTLTDVGYGSQCGKNGEIGEIKFSCCK